jgi:integrase
MQRGSLKKFFDKRKRVWTWRFQWREPGFKGPRTKDLGRCSDMSRAAARSAADSILHQVQGATQIIRSATIALMRFVEDTYLDVKTRKWKASTRGTTEQLIRDYIATPFGSRMLHSITRKDLQAHLDLLAQDDKSESVVGHVRWQLAAIFRMAKGDGLIAVDPTEGLATPRCKPPGEKPILELAQFIRAQMCLEIRERLILRLGVAAGLRPGEIMGLKVGDASEAVLTIRRRIYRRISDTTKSKRGGRVVPLTDPSTRNILREYLAILPNTSPDAWLFPSENPKRPLDYSNVFRRRIRPALEKVGLKWANFQVMRRTFGNKLAEVEKDAKVRAELMGHSVTVHENEYRQAPLKAKQRAMKRLGERLQ